MPAYKKGSRHRRLVQNGIANYGKIRYNKIVSCEIISRRESVVVGWFLFFMLCMKFSGNENNKLNENIIIA